MAERRCGRVAIVTGGGGAIGSECAAELARRAATVVVVDSGVGVEGEDLREERAQEVAERINASGGRAIASMVSVTDYGALEGLVAAVGDEYGTIDIVVNTAGILRFPTLLESSQDDWSAVLAVHLNGYVNMLRAVLPSMVAAGYGRVVGFTSGVGLARTARDAVAYGCAKRAVAALTWQLGPVLPKGISVNAISPIANSRMVRQTVAASSGDPKGVDLTSMPQARDMAPAVAWLCGEELDWFRGRVVFSAGSELSLISRPALVEAVRTAQVADFRHALGALVPEVLGPGETTQHAGGGANPRLHDVFSESSPSCADGAGGTCIIVSRDTAMSSAIATELTRRAATPRIVKPIGKGFVGAGKDWIGATSTDRRVRAVIVVRDDHPLTTSKGAGWLQVLDSHRGTAPELVDAAAWLTVVARHTQASGSGIRVIFVSGAITAAGRTASEAIAQMCRSVNDTTALREVEAFCLSRETTDEVDLRPISQLVAHLACSEDANSLQGAELVAGRGYIGLRSHPRPSISVTFGGPDIPSWVSDVFREAINRT